MVKLLSSLAALWRPAPVCADLCASNMAEHETMALADAFVALGYSARITVGDPRNVSTKPGSRAT